MKIIASIILALHGLIHLLGAASYMKLTEIHGLPYKTTLFGGRWDLGDSGMRVFGALWIVPALGFVIAAIALLAGWDWARALLIGVALFSLALTVADWNVAFMGAIANAAILALLWLGPRLGE
jgi:hypothetical protein